MESEERTHRGACNCLCSLSLLKHKAFKQPEIKNTGLIHHDGHELVQECTIRFTIWPLSSEKQWYTGFWATYFHAWHVDRAYEPWSCGWGTVSTSWRLPVLTGMWTPTCQCMIWIARGKPNFHGRLPAKIHGTLGCKLNRLLAWPPLLLFGHDLAWIKFLWSLFVTDAFLGIHFGHFFVSMNHLFGGVPSATYPGNATCPMGGLPYLLAIL